MTDISVDFSVFPELTGFYGDQKADLTAMREYISTWVEVADPEGLVLQQLIGPYNHSREVAIDAFDAVIKLVDGLGDDMTGYAADMQKLEGKHVKELEKLIEKLEKEKDDEAAPPSGAPSGQGPSGGGAPSGGGPNLTADDETGTLMAAHEAVDTTTDTTDQPPQVVININTDGTVDVSTVDPDDTQTDDGQTNADGSDRLGFTGGYDTTDPMQPPTDDAHVREFYDRVWRKQAANDPLGRSAEQLRLAWEDRDPIAIPSDGSIGFGGAPTLPTTPLSSFSLVP